MKFRPCIDIHNGKVKQIVGGSLKDAGNEAETNFVSDKDAAWYANLYKKDGLSGGHIILLNKEGSEYYDKDVRQAYAALRAWPGGLQLGGGIHPGNARQFLNAGASHVIVTSYVFQNGIMHKARLKTMADTVGPDRLVLDLSCRKKDGTYYIVTDRWQNFTNVCLTVRLLEELSPFCSEFLIHAVDVEGKASGIEKSLVNMLGTWNGCPVTYAGGIRSTEDIDTVERLGNNHVDVTVGSALDLFGGPVAYNQLVKRSRREENP